jgi:hypothetical protein
LFLRSSTVGIHGSPFACVSFQTSKIRHTVSGLQGKKQ